MWLFRLELKRILKSRRTLILLAIALLLSVAMAYLPISFESINRPNEDGTVTELNGLAAIKYKQDLYKTSAGEVTPDRIKSALETYQSCVREYGPVEEKGFPLAVFVEKIVPVRHLLMGLSEAFADPLTGIGADLMDIDPNDIDGAYYEKCAEHLQDVMREQPQIQIFQSWLRCNRPINFRMFGQITNRNLIVIFASLIDNAQPHFTFR